jgi:hypothetical protein
VSGVWPWRPVAAVAGPGLALATDVGRSGAGVRAVCVKVAEGWDLRLARSALRADIGGDADATGGVA